MDPVKIANIYWAAWLLVGFGVYEAWAVFNKYPGDTLSERVRCWFATDKEGRLPTTKWGRVRRILFVCGLAWLVIHWLTPGNFF